MSKVSNVGTLTLGAVTLSGNVTNSGTLTLGPATLSGNVTNSGTLTLGPATLSGDVTNSGTLTIAGTLSGTGTLTNNDNGKVKVDTTNFFAFDGLNYTKANGDTNNVKAGFLSTEQKLQVLGKDVTYAGEVYINDSETGTTLTNGAVTTTIGAVAGTFYVNDDWTYDSSASENATAFYVASAGVLTYNQGANNSSLNTLVNKVTTNEGTVRIVNTTGSVSMDATANLAGQIVIEGGSFNNSGQALNGDTGGTLVLQGVNSATLSGEQKINVNIEVGSGTTLSLSNKDAFNWSNGNKLTVLTGGTVDLGSTRQSLHSSFTVEMAGGTIQGEGGNQSGLRYGLDFYDGGKIHATETSIINTKVGGTWGSGTITIEVDNGKTLKFEGDYAGFSNSTAISKTDTGTLLYKGTEFSNALTISGGVFEYYLEDDRTHGGSISGSGTFRKSGSGTLTLASANTSVSTLNVTGGKLVYDSTTDTTHTISGDSGTFFEKKGSGSLTANTNNYRGEILVSAGTLKNSAENGTSQKVTVANGATVDLNGKAAYYNLTLQEGATLTNSVTSGSATGTAKKQLHTITLEGDAKVTGSSELGMVGSGYATSNLHLNGNTLTKEGTNTFHLFNTTVHSAGLIQINGGTVKADGNTSGTLNITKASLAIDGGAFELGHRSQSIQDLTLTSGSLTIGSVGSDLTLTAQGDVRMSSGTVSGNLCLSGTIKLTGDGTNTVNLGSATLSGTSLRGFTQLESAKPTTSGLQALTYQLWSGTGSVTSTQTSVSVGGVSYAMDAATGTFTTDGTVYYVVEGDTITAGGNSAAEGTASATSFVVDGTLNIAGNASDSLTTVGILTTTTGTGTMVLKTDATLGNGTATQFEGDMQIDSGSKLALGSNAVNGETSAATVDVSTLRSVKLNGGELYIRGVQATLNEVESVANSSGSQLTVYDMTNAAHAVSIGTLTLNAALQLNATWKSTINVDNVTGSGALSVNRTYSSGGSGDTVTLNINSLAGFTGSMTVGTSGKATNLSISTGAVESGVSFGGITTTNVNNFEFNVQTDTTVGTVSLSGSNNSINLSEGKSLSVGTGTVTNGSLSTGSAEVASKSAETPASLSHVKMTGSGFSAAASAGSDKGSISDANVEIAQLAEDASFTIQDMTLTNTTITAATTTTQVKLQNVTANNVVLAQGKFSTNADMAMVGMGGSEGTFSFAGGLAANESITINASTGASLTVDLGDLSCVTAMNPGKYNLSITLSGVALDSCTGLSEGAGITFAGWLGELISASSGVQVSFSKAVAEETPAAAAEGGAATGVTYSTGSVGTVITINGLNVPEPASATLGLAALMMLCARRRRKA